MAVLVNNFCITNVCTKREVVLDLFLNTEMLIFVYMYDCLADILSQFKSSKKQPSSKTWTPPGSKSQADKSPKPSPRNLSGRQSPPKVASRNSRGEKHGISNRSPSPDPILDLLHGSKSPKLKEKESKPPVPKPRSNSGIFSDSPRSKESSPRDKPKPSPRSGSFSKSVSKSPSSELDDLLGMSSKKSPESKRKSTVGDSSERRTSPTSDRSQSPLSKLINSKASQNQISRNGRSSPKNKAKTSEISAGDSRSKSPLSELLAGKKKGEERKSPDLDELLGIKSNKTKESKARSPSRPESPTQKSGKQSPVQRKQKKSLRGSDTSDDDREVEKTLSKQGRKSPASNKSSKTSSKSPDILDLFGGSHAPGTPDAQEKERAKSPNGKQRQNRQSPKVDGLSKRGKQSPDFLDLFDGGRKTDGADDSQAKERQGKKSRSPSPKGKRLPPTKETPKSGKMSPLEKLISGNDKPKKGLLDSDSEEEDEKGATSIPTGKMSLLDALDGGPSAADDRKKKTKKKARGRDTLLDSEDDDDKPVLKFTDRRPKVRG